MRRLSLGVLLVMTVAAQDANLRHLVKQGVATQLVVDGKPFLMLAAENS
jgi:hypothetical protein